MFTYTVFGGVMQSELRFEGLRTVAATAATWTLRTDSKALAAASGVLIGEDRIAPELVASLYRMPDGALCLEYSAYGIGRFLISADGSQITWTPGEAPPLDQVRWIVLGRVLALAMYQAGTTCLHGSAVVLDREGICFLAPKFHGKSTLASALVAAGARLLTDDLLPVDVGPPLLVRPGVHGFRLWENSAEVVRLAGARYTEEPTGKLRVDRLPAARLVDEPVPLRTVYVLEPMSEQATPAVPAERTRLDGMAAFEMLVRHTFVASLLGPGESRSLFRTASAVVRNARVYSLRVVRDLQQLPAVVEQVVAWDAADSGCRPVRRVDCAPGVVRA